MIRIELKDLPPALDLFSKEVREAQKRGLLSAAVATTSWIKRYIATIKPHAPANTGLYRNGWMFKRTEDGAVVYNERMPIAAIIDGGVRPENVKPGKKMREALAEWVVQKRIAKVDEAPGIAWAIAMKMKKTGIFMDDQFRITNKATAWIVQNVAGFVTRELQKVAIKK